jgi:hypothetical protein
MDNGFALFEERMDRLEERMDSRFAVIDSRFAVMDSRFDTANKGIEAAIERAMRQQTNRFIGYLAVGVTVLVALQQILSALS